MTIPFNPVQNGVPAPGQGSFPMPPGQSTFNAPMPAVPAQTIRENQWQGYPVSALPPLPQPQPQQAPAPVQQQQVPQQPQTGWPQQYMQQPAQQIQPGQQVPTQYVQPQTQPGQQFQPAQPQQQVPQVPAGVDVNTVLQGPQFPQELQGVTLGQAITMYGGMRNLILNLQQRQQQQVMAPASPTQQQAPGTQQQAPAPFDWRNPGPGLAAIIGQAIDERLAPVTQQAHLQGAATARSTVAQEIGAQRFAQLEPHAMRLLQGASPQDLANPELWRVAVRTAAGELALSGQLGQQQAPQSLGQQYGGAVPFRPGMQNPAPPLSTFFSEAPQAGGQAVQGVTLSPQQMWFADQLGVPYADYAAYATGVPTQLPSGGRR